MFVGRLRCDVDGVCGCICLILWKSCTINDSCGHISAVCFLLKLVDYKLTILILILPRCER